MNELKINNDIFERIKHVDEFGIEYWYARELQIALDYKKWQKFINVIENAKMACKQSKFIIDNHFTQVVKWLILVLKLQEEEVELVKWFNVDEINNLIKQDKLRKGNILGFQKVLEYKNKE